MQPTNNVIFIFLQTGHTKILRTADITAISIPQQSDQLITIHGYCRVYKDDQIVEVEHC